MKHGKHQFDLLTRELQQCYKRKNHWDGLYTLWTDWEGDRWLLKHILKWMDNLPEWIDQEGDIEIDTGV